MCIRASRAKQLVDLDNRTDKKKEMINGFLSFAKCKVSLMRGLD
jgi:hypothetical protein